MVTGFIRSADHLTSFLTEVVTVLQQGRCAWAAGTDCENLLGSLVITLLGIKTRAMFWGR